jgi:hypothetical protein
MKPSVRSLVLALALAGAAVPALAHNPRIYLPQPRRVSTEVEYRVVLLASNVGARDRRFEVYRVIPQPLGDPERQLLHVSFVPPGHTRTFAVTDLDESAGLLEVIGAPQIVLRARLEIYEGGKLLHTTALPTASTHLQQEDGSVSIPHGGGAGDDEHHVHLQGLARSADGEATTDLTVVNLDAHDDAECAMTLVDAKGEGLLALPFLHVPHGAAVPMNDLLFDALPPAGGDLLEAWAAFACEEDTFTAWAAIYRDGGRDVEYVLPSANLKKD